MKYWLDSEFLDTGTIIDLVSIGLVAEDGRELYLQSTEFDPSKASDWVKENVIAHLATCPHVALGHLTRHALSTAGIHPQLLSLTQHEIHGQCTFVETTYLVGSSDMRIAGAYADCPWRTREQLAHEVTAFMDPEKYGKPELWGWITGYDWVALCQLYGTMMDIPAQWPHHINDLQQILDERGISDEELPQQEEDVHHALADALHIKKLWGCIVRNDCWQ